MVVHPKERRNLPKRYSPPGLKDSSQQGMVREGGYVGPVSGAHHADGVLRLGPLKNDGVNMTSPLV